MYDVYPHYLIWETIITFALLVAFDTIDNNIMLSHMGWLSGTDLNGYILGQVQSVLITGITSSILIICNINAAPCPF